MKGIIQVKELNKIGLFISEIDWDNSFKDKGNPKGNFVMIIEPIEGNENGIIYYQKTDDGFLIEGEAYILTGTINVLKRKVSDWIKAYEHQDFEFIERILQ